MKLKALAAATMLALSGPALADIQPGSTTNAGEMFFSIWSSSLGKSFTRDLGISIDTFRIGPSAPANVPTDSQSGTTTDYAAGSTIVTSAGSVLAAGYRLFFGNAGVPSDLLLASDAIWNVVGIKSNGTPDRLLTTTNVLNPTPLSSAVQSAVSTTSTWLTGTGGVNSTMPGTSFATNDSTTVTTSVLANANSTSFGKNLGGNIFDTTGTVGGTLSFYQFDQAAGNATRFDYADAFWNLASDGTLSYEVASQVPLPGGLVLLASGLLGLVGVGRRRRVAQVAPVAQVAQVAHA